MTWAVIAYLAAAAADWWTTQKALSAGLYEANPILRNAGDLWPVLKAVGTGAAAVLLAIADAEFWLWALAAVTGAVAANNVRVMKQEGKW